MDSNRLYFAVPKDIAARVGVCFDGNRKGVSVVDGESLQSVFGVAGGSCKISNHITEMFLCQDVISSKYSPIQFDPVTEHFLIGEEVFARCGVTCEMTGTIFDFYVTRDGRTIRRSLAHVIGKKSIKHRAFIVRGLFGKP
jgi:hypothetical protein